MSLPKFSPWPSFTDAEIQAASDVLRSNQVNYWTGTQGREFEKEYANYFGSQYSIALANGTVALDAALIALGVGSGDEVVVTPRTFLASVSSIINVGAVPVFADVSLESQNLTPSSVAKVLTSKTKALILVHLAGWPCDMQAFSDLARSHSLAIIEDCAQAHGALYNGQHVGSFGDIGAWSFCQDKILTTGGEGGMVTTNDTQLWSKIWALKDHGKSWEEVFERKHKPGFRWLHTSFGTNWRMTEMQSAIGRIQLQLLPEWSEKRLINAQHIWSGASAISALRVPDIPSNIRHAAYKCYVFIEPDALRQNWSRDRIIDEIGQLGVPCFSGSCSEVYLEKAFDNTDFRPKHRLTSAKQLGETSLMFLVHPTLTDAEIERTVGAIKNVMERASKHALDESTRSAIS